MQNTNELAAVAKEIQMFVPYLSSEKIFFYTQKNRDMRWKDTFLKCPFKLVDTVPPLNISILTRLLHFVSLTMGKQEKQTHAHTRRKTAITRGTNVPTHHRNPFKCLTEPVFKRGGESPVYESTRTVAY